MPARPRHKWDHARERRVTGDAFPDGCERNIRECMHCKMQKITVLPPHNPPWPWHEWIDKSGAIWRGEETPPCFRENVEDMAA